MTDLVERLREHAATSSYLTECRPRGLICEAADEIERLRAELATIKRADDERHQNMLDALDGAAQEDNRD